MLGKVLLFWKSIALFQCCNINCKSRRTADTTQEQQLLWGLGKVLESSVNATISALNASYLSWFRNPMWQNNCSLANTTLQQVWNKKSSGWNEVFPLTQQLANPWGVSKINLRYLPWKSNKQLSISSFPAVWTEWWGFFQPKGYRRLLWPYGEQEEIADFKGGAPT